MNNLGWSAGVAVGALAGGALGQLVGDGLPYGLARCAAAGDGAAGVASGPRARRLSAGVAASGAGGSVPAVIVAELELDLEVFTGPFDLLLTLVLREEVDLLEVELADVVVSLPRRPRGPRRAGPRGRDRVPRAHRRAAGAEVAAHAAARGRGPARRPRRRRGRRRAAGPHARRPPLPRAPPSTSPSGWTRSAGTASALAPPPPFLRKVTFEASGQVYEPAQLGAAIGGLLRTPPPLDLGHLARPAGQRRPSASRTCARLLRSGVVLVRRGRRGRRPHDRRRHPLRAAGALQAGRGALGAGRAVRPDRDPPVHARHRAHPRADPDWPAHVHPLHAAGGAA